MDINFKEFTKLEQFDHECNGYLALRERIVGKGTAYVNQCLFCGRQVGQNIAKRSISKAPPPFDVDRMDRYESMYIEILKSEKQSSSPIFVSEDKSVFNKFKDKLDSFISDYIENNGDRLNISKSGLINSYLAKVRDQYLKGYTSAWKNEENLKSWFIENFSKWFYIYPEVRGVGYIKGKQKNIIIDFILIAKPELVKAGITSEPIGVEAKFLKFNSGDGFTRRASRSVFQALSYWYSNSMWDIPNVGKSEISCVLMLSNLSFREDREFLRDEPGRSQIRMWETFLNLASNANVGEIIYNAARGSSITYWSFKFSGSTYFTCKGGNEYRLSNSNLVSKERIGNIQ